MSGIPKSALTNYMRRQLMSGRPNEQDTTVPRKMSSFAGTNDSTVDLNAKYFCG